MVEFGRRGISPLLATVLLIAFSIGLGAVVMAWGEKYVEERAEFVHGVQDILSSCDRVSFYAVSIEGKPQVCVRGNKIELTLENNGEIGIDTFHASLLGTQAAFNDESILPIPLEQGDTIRTSFAFADVGEPLKLILKPTVRLEGALKFCPGHAKTFEPLRSC